MQGSGGLAGRHAKPVLEQEQAEGWLRRCMLPYCLSLQVGEESLPTNTHSQPEVLARISTPSCWTNRPATRFWEMNGCEKGSISFHRAQGILKIGTVHRAPNSWAGVTAAKIMEDFEFFVLRQ